ncbi:MAG TPA: hypothetical protein VJY33_02910 [Isosphaeraceae bacterium]|nr:hypothetical protein [Isosphaeraceae bacterium]
MIDHVLNRGNGRLRLFDKEDDYHAFERVLAERAKGGHKRAKGGHSAFPRIHRLSRRSVSFPNMRYIPPFVRSGMTGGHAREESTYAVSWEELG